MHTLLLTLFLQLPIADSIVYVEETKARVGDVPIECTLIIDGDSLFFDNAKYHIDHTLPYKVDLVNSTLDRRIRCTNVDGKEVVFYILRSEKALRILFLGYKFEYWEEK